MPTTDLTFLQSLSEAELCELVLMPLFERMGYTDIRYTHGVLEYGKDILFYRNDPLSGHYCYCATVKKTPMVGSVSARHSLHEVLFQVTQALKEPFVSPFGGEEVRIDRVYVVSPFDIDQSAIRSIRSQLRELGNRVFFIDGPRLCTIISHYYPTLLVSMPDPTTRYLHSLAKRLNEASYLSYMGAAHFLSFADIYTAGYLSPTSPDEAMAISFAHPRAGSARLAPLEVLKTSPYNVILADVGSGKTSLLTKLALDLIDLAKQSKDHQDTPLPLLVKLHALDSRRLTCTDALADAIQEYVVRHDGLTDFAIARASQYVLLLDGFDELPRHQEEMAYHLGRLSHLFPAGIFITSRPSRILSGLVTRDGRPFRFYSLNAFTDVDITAFLSRWFRGDQTKAEELFRRIAGGGPLYDFCRNPLFLTLYSALASRVSIGELPTRRTDIYARFTGLLLGEWDSIRSVRDTFSASIKNHVLNRIAHEAHCSKSKTIDPFHLRRVIDQTLDELEGRQARIRKPFEWSSQAMALIDELCHRSCLIRQSGIWDNSPYEFVHLSFQEFFAARWLLQRPQLSATRRMLLDDWWRGTLAFYFGLRETMDDVDIPTPRGASGKGHVLMELLSEATYSSQATRAQVFRVMANDLLYSRQGVQGVEACVAAGRPFVDYARTVVRASDFDGIVAHYIKLLMAHPAEWATLMLAEDGDLWEKLDAREAVELLSACELWFCDAARRREVVELLDDIHASHHLLRAKTGWNQRAAMKQLENKLISCASHLGVTHAEVNDLVSKVSRIF